MLRCKQGWWRGGAGRGQRLPKLRGVSQVSWRDSGCRNSYLSLREAVLAVLSSFPSVFLSVSVCFSILSSIVLFSFPPSFYFFLYPSSFPTPPFLPPSLSPFLLFFFSTQLGCDHLRHKNKCSGPNRTADNFLKFM